MLRYSVSKKPIKLTIKDDTPSHPETLELLQKGGTVVNSTIENSIEATPLHKPSQSLAKTDQSEESISQMAPKPDDLSFTGLSGIDPKTDVNMKEVVSSDRTDDL